MATFVWTSILWFLVVELGLTFILVIPVPRKIRNFISRKVFQLKLGERLSTPLLFIGIGLALALIESYFAHERIIARILEETDDVEAHHHHRGHIHDKEKKYRAERNMYLAGFSLTLLFVIGRITKLMQESVELEEECEHVGAIFNQTVDSVVEPNDGKTGAQIEMKTIRKSDNDKKKE